LLTNTAITTARWSDSDRRWTLVADDGDEHHFDAVVSAVGMLDVPHIPDIPGAQRFRGRRFHSARWDHRKSTAGERVASIGTGASAIQYVPAIAPKTAHLTVFQRTPIWISPRFDFPFSSEQHQEFERDPASMRKLRDEAFDAYESSSFDVDAAQTREATVLARSYLMRKIADPELRAKLTPDYPVGCKRPLMSRDWYPTFALPNVSLETTAIAEITERGVRTADGVEHRVDTIIYGTGFLAADYLATIDVHGSGGRQLHADWSDGAEAYLGTLVAGYPNFFMLYGPNTNGVNSIIYIHEAQTTYIRQLLDVMGSRRARTVEVTQDAQRRYNDAIQADMEGKVWLACTNYFRHPSGKVVTQLPYSGRTFFERTRTLVDDDYQLRA
jgi:cation diffusion facilitator CzcD-associated flavoprotein CzcO